MTLNVIADILSYLDDLKLEWKGIHIKVKDVVEYDMVDDQVIVDVRFASNVSIIDANNIIENCKYIVGELFKECNYSSQSDSIQLILERK